MTPEELVSIAESWQTAQSHRVHQINICAAAGCLSCGGGEVQAGLEAEIKRRGLEGSCAVKGVGCMGPCAVGPVVSVVGKDQATIYYRTVTPADAAAIVASLDTKPVESLLYRETASLDRQMKVVLENSGSIDPEKIEDYIGSDGYAALVRAITEMTPADVVNEITRSGLRGRGGAGFPTGLKWSTVAKTQSAQKYVVCNADEGDPGAFMDRSVLESDPHRVLEGMALAGYAVGANQGYIYCRAEYPLAVKRLKIAIRQAERQGLLGNQICDSVFDFQIEIRLGAGAFVCGEETALISSIEGGRGTPEPRPPYPALSGIWGLPTLINNVETLASIAPIIRKGGEWYSGIGTEKSKGTKVFALAGRVNNTGLIEVPMGIKLRDIVFEIGGGIPEGKRFKAVQTGGPSGGCIPEQYLDMLVDYETLAQAGSIMGSGGMIVMDETSCMVDVARYFMEFCMEESCGKCIPCRVGTAEMFDLLTKITTGGATMRDLDLLVELSDVVKNTSLCGLGQTAPNPLLSTLRYFHEEYDAHILDKVCPAGVCPMNKERLKVA
ncbi:MAG: SLBB domain-containing protein [Armatimonadota bacterium]|nr:SLBB domain-containing protein [Armatimonadota bacterium]